MNGMISPRTHIPAQITAINIVIRQYMTAAAASRIQKTLNSILLFFISMTAIIA